MFHTPSHKLTNDQRDDLAFWQLHVLAQMFAVAPVQDDLPLYAVAEATAAEQRIVYAALGVGLIDPDVFCADCGEQDCSNVLPDGPLCVGL